MEDFKIKINSQEIDSKIIENIVKKYYPEYDIIVDNPFDTLEKDKRKDLDFSTDTKVDSIEKKVYVYLVPHIESA